MSCSVTEAIQLLADGLALVYHEARHVRHLVRAGFLVGTGWERLLSLPANRVQAWRAIQGVRQAATIAQTADEAVECFSLRFSRNLADLEDLYANDHWKHAKAAGGHMWRRVTAAVMALRYTIERGDADEVASAAHSLLCARHNNGVVRDKISELDTAIGVQTGPWWCRRKSVLFVCSGNTCRSPMAEAMARQILGNTFCVESAGVNALDGAPANPHAIAVLAEKGLDIRGHSARRIDPVDTLTFDIIVTMDRAVSQSLRSRGVNPAIITELDISDPYGQGIESYRASANSIELELRRIFPAS